MSADTATTLEQEVHRLFDLLDSMDVTGISSGAEGVGVIWWVAVAAERAGEGGAFAGGEGG